MTNKSYESSKLSSLSIEYYLGININGPRFVDNVSGELAADTLQVGELTIQVGCGSLDLRNG